MAWVPADWDSSGTYYVNQYTGQAGMIYNGQFLVDNGGGNYTQVPMPTELQPGYTPTDSGLDFTITDRFYSGYQTVPIPGSEGGEGGTSYQQVPIEGGTNQMTADQFLDWYRNIFGKEYSGPMTQEGMQQQMDGYYTVLQQDRASEEGSLEGFIDSNLVSLLGAGLGFAGVLPSPLEIASDFINGVPTGIDSGALADAAGNLYSPDPASLGGVEGAVTGTTALDPATTTFADAGNIATDATVVDGPTGIDSGAFEDAAGNLYDAGTTSTTGTGGAVGDIIEEVGNFTGGGELTLEQQLNDIFGSGTQAFEGLAADSSLQNAALAEAAGLIPAGTLSSVLGDAAKAASLINTAKNIIAGGEGSGGIGEAFRKLLSGDTSALKDLLGAGIPLALLGGLLEQNDNPLAEQLKAAATGALDATQQFAGLELPGITDSQQRAIDLANENVGDWQPYLDKSGALTDEAATLARSNIGDWQALLEKAGLTADEAKALAEQYQGGWQPYIDQAGALGTEAADAARRTAVDSQGYFDKAGAFGDEAAALARSREGGWQPYLDRAGELADKAAGGIPGMDLNAYMNPYLAAALEPAMREIERAAAKKRIAENARAGMKSAFGGSRHALESGILDRNEMEEIGDLYHRGLASGYDRATGLMSSDLARMLQSGQLFSSMAGQYGNLSNAEVANLMKLMEQFRGMGESTGALGSKDVANLLASGKFFSDLGGQYGSLGNLDVANLLKLSGEYGDLASKTGALGTTDVANLLRIGGEYGDLATQTGSLNTGDVTNLIRAGELERQPYTDERTQLADTAKLYTSIIPGTTSANTALQEPSLIGQITGALGAYSTAKDIGIVP
jgi:hypothetical protein